MDESPRRAAPARPTATVPSALDAAPEVTEALAPAKAPPLDEDEQRSAVEQAQLIRLPVVAAIRGEHASARARYDAMREAIERSGPTTERWSATAGEVFGAWERALGEHSGRLDLGTLRCFRAGCDVVVRFPSEPSANRASAAFRSIREDEVTHGGRVQTPVLPIADDRAVVTWIMLRPELP